tara:strand:+ start:547 stop:948 length:402 start_codon:yes stop_codon:yes gene_type:complete
MAITQNVYWIERDSIGIALYDPNTTDVDRFTSLTEVLQVTLYYHKKALHFGVNQAGDSTMNTTGLMSEDSELPTQFHQYIVDKAIQLGYEQKPEAIQLATYFERKFEKGVKEGKTFANRNRITGMRHVSQTSY